MTFVTKKQWRERARAAEGSLTRKTLTEYRDIPTTEGDQVPDQNDNVTFEKKVEQRMKELRRDAELTRIEREARRRLNEDADYKRVSGL